MIGLLTALSTSLIFMGGAMFAIEYRVAAVALTALGAGWLGILFGALRRAAQRQA